MGADLAPIATERNDGLVTPRRLVQLTAFVSSLDRFVMPPMVVAMSHDLGLPLTQVMQVTGVYLFAYGLMQPVWGLISDRLGLVRMMRVTLLLAAGATIASVLVPSTQGLLVARGLAGVGFSAAIPASLVYVSDTVAAGKRQRELTDLVAVIALGAAVASLGAGVLSHLSNWRIAFVVTGVSALLLVVKLGALAEPPRTRAHHHFLAPLAEVFRSRATVLVLLLAVAEGAVLLGSLTYLPAAMESSGANASIAGAITAIYGVSVFGFARVANYLSRRHVSPVKLIAMGGAAALVACICAAISQKPLNAAVATALIGMAWVFLHSTLQTWATEVLPSARPTVVALFGSGLFVGSALAAVLVAGFAETNRYGDIFLLAAILTVPLSVLGSRGRAKWSGT
nr:MFS transporter [Planosporangium flavigriseum]